MTHARDDYRLSSYAEWGGGYDALKYARFKFYFDQCVIRARKRARILSVCQFAALDKLFSPQDCGRVFFRRIRTLFVRDTSDRVA